MMLDLVKLFCSNALCVLKYGPKGMKVSVKPHPIPHCRQKHVKARKVHTVLLGKLLVVHLRLLRGDYSCMTEEKLARRAWRQWV